MGQLPEIFGIIARMAISSSVNGASGSALTPRATCACARRAMTNCIAGILPRSARSNALRSSARFAIHVHDLVARLEFDDPRRLLQQQLVERRPAARPAAEVARLTGLELVRLRRPGVADRVIALRGFLGLVGAHDRPSSLQVVPVASWSGS